MNENKLVTSNRINRLISSPIRKFLPLVNKAEKEGVKVYKLNIGDPDTLPPRQVLACLKNFKGPNIPYAASPGLPRFNQAWVNYYHQYRIRFKPDNIIATVGASEAIWMTLLATTDPGDEVLVFEPFYTNYKTLTVVTNIKLVPVTLSVKDNFKLPSASVIAKKITPRTKAIIIINPDNPTGKVWTNAELGQIIKIAVKHNLFIISDETYRGLVFRGKSGSILNLPNTRNNTIIIDSLSKRFSMPGIRLGCLASFNSDIIANVLKIAMSRLSAPTIAQICTCSILENHQAYLKKLIAEYKQRQQVAAAGLKSIPGLITSTPQGAFYQILKLPLENSEDFIKFLLEDFRYKNETVLLSPMSDFYITPGLGQNEVRLAFVLNRADLRRAVKILEKALKAYLGNIS